MIADLDVRGDEESCNVTCVELDCSRVFEAEDRICFNHLDRSLYMCDDRKIKVEKVR